MSLEKVNIDALLKTLEHPGLSGASAKVECLYAAQVIRSLTTEVTTLRGQVAERERWTRQADELAEQRAEKFEQCQKLYLERIERCKQLTAEVTELKEEVYRRDCDIEGLNSDIVNHFEAGWDSATDYRNNCGEEYDDALRIYLNDCDRLISGASLGRKCRLSDLELCNQRSASDSGRQECGDLIHDEQ